MLKRENTSSTRHAALHGADDRLSRCATALHALALHEASAYDDLAAFGAPSECTPLVRRDLERRALAIVAAHGFTAEAFERALGERTCPRFVYESGLGRLLPAPEDT